MVHVGSLAAAPILELRAIGADNKKVIARLRDGRMEAPDQRRIGCEHWVHLAITSGLGQVQGHIANPNVRREYRAREQQGWQQGCWYACHGVRHPIKVSPPRVPSAIACVSLICGGVGENRRGGCVCRVLRGSGEGAMPGAPNCLLVREKVLQRTAGRRQMPPACGRNWAKPTLDAPVLTATVSRRPRSQASPAGRCERLQRLQA